MPISLMRGVSFAIHSGMSDQEKFTVYSFLFYFLFENASKCV